MEICCSWQLWLSARKYMLAISSDAPNKADSHCYRALRYAGITFAYTAVAILLNYSEEDLNKFRIKILIIVISVASSSSWLCERHRTEHCELRPIRRAGVGWLCV